MRRQTLFGAWLEAQRAARDLPLRELGRLAGVNGSQISRYINGERAPSRKNLRALAQAFGVDRAELDAMVEADEAARRGPLTGADLHKAGPDFAIVSPTATTEIRDPRLVGFFYGFLGRWERMTEAERASLRADEIEIPRRPPGGEDDATSGEPGAADPA